MAKVQRTLSELRAQRESRAYHKKHSPKPNKNKRKPKLIIKRRPDGLPCETYGELRQLKYRDYLKSKYWKIVRKVVLKRDGNACVICKSPYMLQIHHENYKHIANELNHLGDLMTLCDKCHTEHHYAQA